MPIVSSAWPRIGSITSFVVVSCFSLFEIVVLNINLFPVILGMETDDADVEMDDDKVEGCVMLGVFALQRSPSLQWQILPSSSMFSFHTSFSFLQSMLYIIGSNYSKKRSDKILILYKTNIIIKPLCYRLHFYLRTFKFKLKLIKITCCTMPTN